MSEKPYSHAKTFLAYSTVSNVCLLLAVLAGAFTWLSPRVALLPAYIFFFSFAAFTLMLFQGILSRSADRLPELDLREQRGVLGACLAASGLCVLSELAAVGWPKIPAGLLLALAVVQHGGRVWQGHAPRQVWDHLALRFFATDMLFLLVAAVGLTALGWKETWPSSPLIPGFLRPATVFLGASFPLTLTFMGFLYRYIQANGGLSPAETRIFHSWYHLLVGGVLFFLVVILLDQRPLMLLAAVVLTAGVFIINLLLVPRLVGNPGSVGLLFAFAGLVGLLATSAAGSAVVISRTPTAPAGGNPILLSHVHIAQLGWVCISFWGMLYTIWPMMLRLDAGEVDWLPLDAAYGPWTRRLARSQLLLVVTAIASLVVSHMTDRPALIFASGLAYAAGAAVPLVVLRLAKTPDELTVANED